MYIFSENDSIANINFVELNLKSWRGKKILWNSKIESFRLVYKLHYLKFAFQIYRSSHSQIFFWTGALKSFAMLKFLSNKIAGLQACNFIKKRLQHRCFSVKFSKSLRASSSQNIYGGYIWKYLMNFLFFSIMQMMNRVIVWYVLVLQRLFHFIACVSFLSISFSLFYFFVDFTTFLGIEVSLSILQIKHWSCS